MPKKKEDQPKGTSLNEADRKYIKETVHQAVDEIRRDIVPDGYYTCAKCGTMVLDGHKCYKCKKADPEKEPEPKKEPEPNKEPEEEDEDWP